MQTRPCHRSARRCPTPDQLSRLESVRAILHGRRNKRSAETLSLLREAGFEPQWLRVRWTGGSGSYVVMRGNILRILVGSTKSGLSDPQIREIHPRPGITHLVTIAGKRRGYRYGWCVELRP